VLFGFRCFLRLLRKFPLTSSSPRRRNRNVQPEQGWTESFSYVRGSPPFPPCFFSLVEHSMGLPFAYPPFFLGMRLLNLPPLRLFFAISFRTSVIPCVVNDSPVVAPAPLPPPRFFALPLTGSPKEETRAVCAFCVSSLPLESLGTLPSFFAIFCLEGEVIFRVRNSGSPD